MKKLTLYTLLALMLVMLVGCKKKVLELKSDDVKVNTILIKNDGTVQAANVEGFTKDYYNLSELKGFVSNELKEYNSKSKNQAITMTSLELHKKNAILILNYASIKDYASFNEVTLKNNTVQWAHNQSEKVIPNVFTSATDGSYVTSAAALENEKYRVLIIDENIDVEVEGNIKFYSNAALVDKNQVETDDKGTSVIIYKPW